MSSLWYIRRVKAADLFSIATQRKKRKYNCSFKNTRGELFKPKDAAGTSTNEGR